MTCATAISPDICPTADQLVGQYTMLLPRGRAFGEGGKGRLPGGIIHGVLYVLAVAFAACHAALCALSLEFVCATADKTLDWWDYEYDFPDVCDPWASLCAKVAAQGGSTCAFLQEIAWGKGWSITCGTDCASSAKCIEAGMVVGGPVAGVLYIVVDLEASPAYLNSPQTLGPVAGFLEADMPVLCGPDLSALDCLIQRVAQAHLKIVYLYF